MYNMRERNYGTKLVFKEICYDLNILPLHCMYTIYPQALTMRSMSQIR